MIIYSFPTSATSAATTSASVNLSFYLRKLSSYPTPDFPKIFSDSHPTSLY